MIDKFKVERFRSIESLEIELGIVNVFIGANGSGKSNLLEAIGVLGAAAFGKVDGESLIRRGCRTGFFYPMFREVSSESGTVLNASGGLVRYSAELVSPAVGAGNRAWRFTREKLLEDDKPIVERSDKAEKGEGDFQVGLAALHLATLSQDSPVAQFMKALASYGIYSPDTPILRGAVQDPQIREPIGLSGGGLAEAVYQLLQRDESAHTVRQLFRAAIPNLRGFHSFPARNVTGSPAEARPTGPGSFSLAFEDRFFRIDGNTVYVLGANEINEGALYFLFIAILCLHPEMPATVSLENVDHGMNPLLAKKLIENICQWVLDRSSGRQILMTTQNPLALDGLPLQDDRIRLFIVDRDNRGATQVSRFLLTDKLRDLAAKKDWPLSRLWVNGLIGGVPNV